MNDGYYRFPTIHGDQIVFVCEDDLWTVDAGGGSARRLTAGRGESSRPRLSPDGEWLAFTGREEGPAEVYVMPSSGGEPRRLTFTGVACTVVGWQPEGDDVLFASSHRLPFARQSALYAVSSQRGDQPRPLPWGDAAAISFGPRRGSGHGIVLGRHTADPARWKRYRGGLAGEIWIDPTGRGRWRRLLQLEGNLASPMWVGDRIFFVSDHEGFGNLYSCRTSGRDLHRHSDWEEFYLRNPDTDGERIVYHMGADLYVYDPQSDTHRKVAVALHSPRVQRSRKFASAERHLDGFHIHPHGSRITITSRGKLFTMGLWAPPVSQLGAADGVRYRLPRWLNDGERVCVVSDEGGEHHLELFRAGQASPEAVLHQLDVGEVHSLRTSPTEALAAMTNQRCELLLVDLTAATLTVVDHSEYGRLGAPAWSPDGAWLAYSRPHSPQTTQLQLYNIHSGESHALTSPVLRDFQPVFDPDGKYLYFLSCRDLDPVYDAAHFDLNFPRAVRPYLITLRADLTSPFIREPKAPGEKPGKPDENSDNNSDNGKATEEKESGPPAVVIDTDGIEERVVPFPVSVGRYGDLAALPRGRVLWTVYPIKGSLGRNIFAERVDSGGALEMWDFERQDKEQLLTGASAIDVSLDGKTIVYRSRRKLRALKAGVKPDTKAGSSPGPRSGWIDLSRCRVSVDPPSEWRQMMREAWRLQRDHFWTDNMSHVRWEDVYVHYEPLLDRVATRSEFSDLMWEMQGELGTSHAYEIGGDYRQPPQYALGLLGADIEWDAKANAYRFTHIITGDPWAPSRTSPLRAPGVQVGKGDLLLAVGGRSLTADEPPQKWLVNQAGREVVLTVRSRDGEPRDVIVQTLRDETPARYREWVENNRAWVHEQTDGRVGYLHIPDMGPRGYAEFHRLYLAECWRDGLIVDVRYNGGGHVSQLLLEKLARKPIGYDIPRWGHPIPYPAYSLRGPVVAVTNEAAGSDGDIFSHCFKLMGLGPLIGKRTWGGVIGISPRIRFVDGGLTTQPEYSFWFEDVGWCVENYGADPDIEVDIRPQDYAGGRDTQLERAVREVKRLLRQQKPKLPEFDGRPNLAPPRLPPRDVG